MSNSGYGLHRFAALSSNARAFIPHPEVLPPTWSGGSLEGCRPSARAIILRGSAPKRRAPQHKVVRSRGAFFRARVLPVTTSKPRSNSERTIEAVSSTKRHLSTRFQQQKESGTPADALS